MNARSQVFELAVEGLQVDEAVACLFQTILFHRSLGKFRYKQESSYSLGTVGFEDVDCDFIDLTYVCCASEELNDTLKRKISDFSDALRNGRDDPKSGHITLEFYQKKRSRWPFNPECIPWEMWTIRLELIKLNNEHKRQEYREKLGNLLAESIMYIAEVMNKNEYVPKMPCYSELDLIFDTGYSDVQPYLFNLSFHTSGMERKWPMFFR